jgi:hypothetical protein
MSRDSGLFAYGGWRILHGALPYRDFWDNKLPGVFYLDALAIRLFGPYTWGLVVFQMAYMAVTGWLFFTLARRFCSRAVAVIVTIFFLFYHSSYGLSDGGNYTESYIALPMLAGALLLVNWSQKRKGLLAPALAGVFVAAAALIKQPAASLVGGMLLFVLLADRRRPAYAAAVSIITGAGVVVLLMIAWMAQKGILADAIDANLVFNRLYLVDSYTARPGPVLWNLARGLNLLALPLAGALGGIVSLGIRRRPVSGIAWLLIPWFMLDLGGLAMGGRFYNHYFLAILPSAFLLMGILVDDVIRFRRSALVAAVIGLALIIGPVWRYENSTNPDLTGLPICSITQQQCHAINWIVTRRLPLGVMLPAEEIADWIEARTNESDTIYVWGWETRIAFLTRRAFPSRYLHTHPLGATGFNRDVRIRELARDIEKHRPRFIVDDSPLMPTTAPPLDPSQPVPPQFSPFFRLDGYEPVQEVVSRFYEPVAVVAGCPIYQVKQ